MSRSRLGPILRTNSSRRELVASFAWQETSISENNTIVVFRNVIAAVFTIMVCMSFSPVAAQEQEQGYFALPFEFEGNYGAPNGNALLLRFMPLWRMPVKENWSLVHLNLLTLADAPPLPGNPINPDPDKPHSLNPRRLKQSSFFQSGEDQPTPPQN